jgi:hypothetical protein
MFGDMIQLPPVRDTALYTRLRDSTTAEVAQGRGLWLRTKQVFFLTQQKRQFGDDPLIGILRRWRQQKLTREDELLSTRVITPQRSAVELLKRQSESSKHPSFSLATLSGLRSTTNFAVVSPWTRLLRLSSVSRATNSPF